jgi:hypothetical protein
MVVSLKASFLLVCRHPCYQVQVTAQNGFEGGHYLLGALAPPDLFCGGERRKVLVRGKFVKKFRLLHHCIGTPENSEDRVFR